MFGRSESSHSSEILTSISVDRVRIGNVGVFKNPAEPGDTVAVGSEALPDEEV
jgi:hypothetical protein